MDAGTFGAVVRYPCNRCQVCGGRSSGIHYGVSACEGCKAFYKRCVDNKTVYRCFFGENCDIGPNNRSHCKACRMMRCVKAGMQLNTTKMGRTPRRTPATTRQKLFDIAIAGAPNGLSLASSNSKETNAAKEIRIDTEVPEGSIVISNSHGSPLHELENGRNLPKGGQLQILPSYPRSGNLLQPCIPCYRTEESGWRLPSTEGKRPAMLDVFFRSQAGGPSRSFGQFPSERFSQIHPDFSEDMQVSLSEQLSGVTTVGATLKAVHEAIETYYGASFAEWDAFMYDVLVNGNTPYQPQISLKGMMESLMEAVKGTVKTHCQFTFALPGFADLDHDDQQILLSERWQEHFVMTRIRYLRYQNMFYTSGSFRIHYSKYWMSQLLDSEYMRAIFSAGELLNKIEITNVEALLMLIVTIFRPETTRAKNKSALFFLHGHYMDCLLYAIRSRSRTSIPGPEREKIILDFLDQMRVFHGIQWMQQSVWTAK